MNSDSMPPKPTVLITGASGLIGTRLARSLHPDYEIVALDVVDLPPEFPQQARMIHCDLTSDESTAEALRSVARFQNGEPLASVVHLAAYYDFSGEPSPLYDELTVAGTRRLIRSLNEILPTEQFIFSSSLLVMKPVDDDGVLDETSPVQAEWDYPQSKLDAEAVIEEERGAIPTVILRLAGAYDEDGHSPPLTQQIWRIRERKIESFFFPGDETRGQSFVHLDDVASSIRAAIDRRRSLDGANVFLIGEPDVMTYAELQDRIGETLHDREWPTLRIPAPLAKAGAWIKDKLTLGDEDPFIKPWMVDLADAHYPVSIDKARKRLEWWPEHRLRDVLDEMLARVKADPLRWDRENDLPVEDPRPAETQANG